MNWVAEWYRKRQVRKYCFHHDMHLGETFIRSQLIETGKSKMFWCTNCGRGWFL